eukprot:TRINITY_DN1498_c2_g1_i1.p1 TRINITY_DN1498_c2_g1~~TRINITY_DN1498_c2_g1_i1.p1  ORF type:complete len:523 (+),score=148.69 TRINITY_DN1498_c2_g1_i1:64-1569(+)
MSLPSANLFVGDLPVEIDENTLKAVLGPYGNILSLKILPPGKFGKGCAVVSFASVAEATWIVENLSGNIPQGLATPITAKYKSDNRGGKGGGFGGVPGNDMPSDSVFIGELPLNFDDSMVATIFAAYGNIRSHKLVAPGASGRPACIITFESVDQAKWMVDNLNGNIPQGLTEPIHVKYKRQDKGKGGSDWGQGQYGGDWQQGAGKGGVVPPVAAGGAGTANESVFVGDLPPNMDDQMLLAVFGAYGTIASHKMLSPGSISGKMAAIITFASVDQAKWLVDNLNMNIPQGLTEPIKVRFKDVKGGYGKAAAPPPQQYGAGPYGGYDGGKGGYDGGKGIVPGGTMMKALVDGLFSSGAMPGSGGVSRHEEHAVFVGGLPYDTTDEDMYRMFSPFGAILPYGVTAMKGDTAPCKGFGFVNFFDMHAAEMAVATLHGTKMPDGKELRVSIKQKPGQGAVVEGHQVPALPAVPTVVEGFAPVAPVAPAVVAPVVVQPLTAPAMSA